MNKKVTSTQASTQAWLITIAAIGDLIVMISMSTSNSLIGPLGIIAGCEAVLIVCAVASWKKYFETLIEEKANHSG